MTSAITGRLAGPPVAQCGDCFRIKMAGGAWSASPHTRRVGAEALTEATCPICAKLQVELSKARARRRKGKL